jgi:histidyl-tRNA synthetase
MVLRVARGRRPFADAAPPGVISVAMPIQPRTPPGVMELLPPQQLAFQRMLDTIRRGYERFGFLPIETPVFELTDVLLMKSGGETEKQVYFVQSTGTRENERTYLGRHFDAVRDLVKKFGVAAGEHLTELRLETPELAMRFDLTVPLARYVAEHEHELNFPFRRYQIQRVYRGERPMKGRYREFYQCDIDVIGKDSLPLAYDAEVPAVIHGIFSELGFGKFTIHINNRKLLRGLLAGIERAAAASLMDVLAAGTDSRETLARLHAMGGSESFIEGLRELEAVYEGTRALGVPDGGIELDLSIARGLDYYTGTVYETFLDEHRRIGSICSGGRYDNLAGHYTKSKLPGVGISIGATRLFSQLLEMKVIDEAAGAVAQVCVLRVEAGLAATYAGMASELRAAGMNVEVYGGDDKLGKQLKYAVRGKVPLAVIYGARERDAGIVKVKDLRVEKEHEVARDRLVEKVRELLA